MSLVARRPVRTAQPDATIWSSVSEDDFRRDLVALEKRTNAVPVDVQVFPLKEDVSNALRLPLEVEQQVADGIAILAAVQEGAQSVAAVCLEQHLSPKAVLKIRVAGADFIDETVRTTMTQLCAALVSISIDGSHGVDSAEELLGLIIKQHQSKILGRLRSRKWTKPRYLAASHKQPLWQDFDNVIHRSQHVYPTKKEKVQRQSVVNHLKALGRSYQIFEEVPGNVSCSRLETLVKLTYEFCRQSEIRQFAARLEELRPTAQIAAAVKCLHQLEKVGAYWKIALNLVASATTYRHIFGAVELIYLPPYASIPTSIAYESWAKTCHVHAEVQLVVEYDLHGTHPEYAGRDIFLPRIIGTSKYLCYLCYLFIKFHGRFIVPNTHGRLYDQWTVPDLAEYSDGTREHYAKVLAKINEVACKQSEEEPCWRAEPMTSRQNLLLDEKQEADHD